MYHPLYKDINDIVRVVYAWSGSLRVYSLTIRRPAGNGARDVTFKVKFLNRNLRSSLVYAQLLPPVPTDQLLCELS